MLQVSHLKVQDSKLLNNQLINFLPLSWLQVSMRSFYQRLCIVSVSLLSWHLGLHSFTANYNILQHRWYETLVVMVVIRRYIIKIIRNAKLKTMLFTHYIDWPLVNSFQKLTTYLDCSNPDKFIKDLYSVIVWPLNWSKTYHAVEGRPYSALGSSDAEIGAGRAYTVPTGGYYASTHR